MMYTFIFRQKVTRLDGKVIVLNTKLSLAISCYEFGNTEFSLMESQTAFVRLHAMRF